MQHLGSSFNGGTMRRTRGRRPGASGGRARHAAALGLAVAIAGLATAAGLRAQSDVLHFGFSSWLIEDVNLTDATAAMTIWVREVGKAAGVYREAEAIPFADLPSLLRAADSTDLFAMATTDYLSVERTLPAEPCMTYMASGEIETEYVVVATAGTASIAALRGKRLIIANASAHRMVGDLWFDVLLMEAGLPERGQAFPDARFVAKPSQAILPLFFGQADVALVTRASYDTAVELNPQLGKRLGIVARSPRLLPGLVCARKSLPTDVRRRYVEKATTIHENPRFRQTIQLLRMNKLVAWDPHYLDAARALTARYQALRKIAPRS
jgi:hypothetical protein